MSDMKVHDAVSIAKQWLLETYKDENITNLGLEEVDFDDDYGVWKITLGFSRPWDQNKNIAAMLNGVGTSTRVFKVVSVDEKRGEVKSLKNRSTAA